ncbi:MAG: Stp1/IreP family PP2C-type Ser/Thr phosphatase [Vicinamibacteria bacterium]
MIKSAGVTDIGRRRQLNEDALFVDDESGLYVVADGMGGHNAGEVASKLAVETVSNFVRRSGDDEEITWPYGVDPSISINANRLRTAIMLANKRVWKEADNREDYTGMGTTIVAGLVEDDHITLCAAGDSRAYRFRGDALDQITTDDSWVQVALTEGLLQADEAENHPMKNIITKAVGAKQNIELTVYEEPLKDGDVYLLCTDGLHGMVAEAKLLEILRDKKDDLEQTVQTLVDAANENGGKDNITAVVLHYRK